MTGTALAATGVSSRVRRRGRYFRGGRRRRLDAIDSDRIRNVLEVLFAGIRDWNLQLAAYLSVRIFRQADATRRSNLLQSRCDVDAVAKDVVLLDDDVSDIYTDTELDAPIDGDALVALGHSALHRHRAGYGFHDRRERKQQAVASGFDDVSLVSGDERVDELDPVCFQGHQGAFLVRAHDARVAHHVGGDDRSEVTLDTARRHSLDPHQFPHDSAVAGLSQPTTGILAGGCCPDAADGQSGGMTGVHPTGCTPDRRPILTPLWSAPLRVDTIQAARLTIRRACSCSNLSGLRYPSAEWSRLLL